jgi:hypothetical protein
MNIDFHEVSRRWDSEMEAVLKLRRGSRLEWPYRDLPHRPPLFVSPSLVGEQHTQGTNWRVEKDSGTYEGFPRVDENLLRPILLLRRDAHREVAFFDSCGLFGASDSPKAT